MTKQDEELLKLMLERRNWFIQKENGTFVTDFSNPEVIKHIMQKLKGFDKGVRDG